MRLTQFYPSTALLAAAYQHPSDWSQPPNVFSVHTPTVLRFKPVAYSQGAQNLCDTADMRSPSKTSGHTSAPQQDNARRILSALVTVQYPTQEPLDGIFQDNFTWLSRGDDRAIKEVSKNDHFSALIDPDIAWSEFRDLSPAALAHGIHGHLSQAPVFSHYTVKNLSDKAIDTHLSSGKRLSISPAQARTLLKLISAMQITSPTNKHEPYVSPDDHLSLWIKPGVTAQAFTAYITEQSGQIGSDMLQRFLHALADRGHIDLGVFSPHGRAINMVEWRDRYIKAVLDKINIPEQLQETLHITSLGSDQTYGVLLDKIDNKVQKLMASNAVGPLLLNLEKFHHFIAVDAFNCLAAACFKANCPLSATSSLPESSAAEIRHVLGEIKDKAVSKQLLNAMDFGWVDIQLLGQEDFKALMLTTFGLDKSGHIAGIAVGAKIFINLLYEPKDKTEGSISLSPKVLSTCIHELRHALDWLQDPKQFKGYNTDALTTYALERRAFHIQNEVQRQLASSGKLPAKDIRFAKTKAIREHILSAYPQAKSSSAFRQASQYFDHLRPSQDNPK